MEPAFSSLSSSAPAPGLHDKVLQRRALEMAQAPSKSSQRITRLASSAFGGDVAAAEQRQLRLELVADGIGQERRGGVTSTTWLSGPLGLGEQIGGHEGRVWHIVGDDQHLEGLAGRWRRRASRGRPGLGPVTQALPGPKIWSTWDRLVP